MKSRMLLAGTEGCTATTLVATVISPTGVKSFNSQGSLLMRMGLAMW